MERAPNPEDRAPPREVIGGGKKGEDVEEAELVRSHWATAEAKAELLEEVEGRVGGPTIPPTVLVTGEAAVVLEGVACVEALAALEVTFEAVRVEEGVVVGVAELMEDRR